VIGIGVGLLCVAAAVGLLRIRGKILLARKIAELKAQGIPTSYAELEAKYKLPEGTPNAADIYMKAFAAYRPPADKGKQKLLPVMGSQNDPNDDEPYPPQRMAAAAEFVEQNQEMFALLHEAGEVEGCYYAIDYAHGPDAIVELTSNIKLASRCLMVAGIYYSQTNQPQRAYDAAMDHLRLGQSHCPSHHLFGHLTRIATLARGVGEIQDIINRTSLDETQLRQLQECLRQVSQTTTIGSAFAGEICVCLEYQKLGRDFEGTNEMMFYARCLTSQSPTALIKTYQRMIAIDKLPIQEQLSKVREACHVNILYSPFGTALPLIQGQYQIHLRIRADMDCAIMALAIERYRLKEGNLPETLEALVPGYLPQVYLDPFDGKPLRYKRIDSGYMIYTIGEDGSDDGGRGWDRKTRTRDWVFRVYR
jgi:hypothetical protein